MRQNDHVSLEDGAQPIGQEYESVHYFGFGRWFPQLEEKLCPQIWD